MKPSDARTGQTSTVHGERFPIVTATLAEIYAKQGEYREAAEAYRQIDYSSARQKPGAIANALRSSRDYLRALTSLVRRDFWLEAMLLWITPLAAS